MSEAASHNQTASARAESTFLSGGRTGGPVVYKNRWGKKLRAGTHTHTQATTRQSLHYIFLCTLLGMAAARKELRREQLPDAESLWPGVRYDYSASFLCGLGECLRAIVCGRETNQEALSPLAPPPFALVGVCVGWGGSVSGR